MYRWGSGPALVQTVDFFTPIVDDPHTYGQIAAANALSDIYAMGGRPVTALAIACFPKTDFDAAIIRAVFLGGFEKLREAGVALLGGHTVQDSEIKFGYAVTGEIDPDRVWSNAGAKPGDRLFLTKAIGTGVIGTAIKAGRAEESVVAAAVRSMVQLNRDATEALRALDAGSVNACTDVTGFGLAGHASEMAEASGVTLRIDARAVPWLNGARALAGSSKSGGLRSNLEHFEARVRIAETVDPAAALLLFDPQTSGGLLIAAPADRAAAVDRALTRAGVVAVCIGEAVPRGDTLIDVLGTG